MGLLIRNIGEKIEIAGIKYDVEINKSTSNHKYDIHIQNEKSRVEFTGADFLKYVALIKYADEQLDILKSKDDMDYNINLNIAEKKCDEMVDANKIVNVFNILNRECVDYILLYNHRDEIPNNLQKGKDIDLLVRLENRSLCRTLLAQNGFMEVSHPWGKANKFEYLYGMQPNEMWEDREGGLKLDLHFKLGCKSMTPNKIIPLADQIDAFLWERRVWDKSIGCWRLKGDAELLYNIVRAVFDKNNFSETYISEILRQKQYINDEDVQRMLELVFYSFTDKLIELVNNNEFEKIYREYIRYDEY